MSDWTAGYVADINYTYGYYPELNPLMAKLPFLNTGLVFPEIATACELGFGQGLSANIHAAASPATWAGTDFNPSQAAFAQELATVSGSGARLYAEAFAEFCARPDLPDFDYIGLHGIWSWISGDNRAVVVDFVRRKLKVGGILYVSYNTQPGWAAMVPLRHLLTRHAEVMAAPGRGLASRIDAAMEFTEKLLAVNPNFVRANPLIADRIGKIKLQNRNYLAHEYFNRDWHPMHFAEMAELLAPAKLTYACSANPLEHVDDVNLTAEQNAFLGEIPDAMFRQTVRDFMVNQQFRKDYWVKGERRLSPLEQMEQLRAHRIVLAVAREAVELKVHGALGEATLNPAIYEIVLDALSDHRPKAIGQIEEHLRGSKITFPQLLQAVFLLVAKGCALPVQDDHIAAKVRRNTDKLNAHLMGKARGSGDIAYLASPLAGGGLPVDRFQQLFLAAIADGKQQAADWAAAAWQILSVQDEKLVKNGIAMESPEENLQELHRQATEFQNRLPLLRSLGIVN